MTSAPAPRIALILGEPAVRVQQAEARMIERALGGPGNAFSLSLLHAGDPDVLGRAFDQIRTMPMMCSVRAVVLREMEKASTALLDALMDYCDKPVQSTVLILVGAKLPEPSGGVNRGIRLENKLKKSGEVQRFASAKEDPIAWCKLRATEQGARISHRAAQLLVAMVGPNLGLLEMELAKAIAWAGPGVEVDVPAIEQVASMVAEAEVWGLTRALVRRDPDAALTVLHRLLEGGDATHRILAMVTWQFRQLITLQDCLRTGSSPQEAGLRMRPADLDEASRSLRERPLVEDQLLANIARTNRLLNRSKAGDRRVFERLIMELATR